jgi:hypothetical protein
MLEVLGDHAYGKYIEAKEIEWDQYRTKSHPLGAGECISRNKSEERTAQGKTLSRFLLGL